MAFGLSLFPNHQPLPIKPIECHPDSQCPECLEPPADESPVLEPKDTFTPSFTPGPFKMADPEKYPDYKPAENGRIGTPFKMADPEKYPDYKPAENGRIGTPLKRPLFVPSLLLK